MSLIAGMKFKPRPAGLDSYNGRFNDRVIEVLEPTPDSRGRLLVSSWNAEIGRKKRQSMSMARLLSSKYQRIDFKPEPVRGQDNVPGQPETSKPAA